jgi:hypothetical protein
MIGKGCPSIAVSFHTPEVNYTTLTSISMGFKDIFKNIEILKKSGKR